MSDDREKLDLAGELQTSHEQQSVEDAGDVNLPVETPQPFAEPVPPPPSAPTEFLASQWVESFPSRKTPRNTGEPLAPPPPSAPGEFLSAQWMGGVVPEFDPGEADGTVFQDAVPGTIESVGQLQALVVEEVLPYESAASADGTESKRLLEPAPARIREVALSPDEEISMVFLPDEGVVDSVPRSGQALILTSHRLIAFRGLEGFRDTHLAMASEISQCSVRTGQRNWGAILQGLMIMVGGAFLYLIVGYWLAGQVSGPNVPFLNIDVAPLIALLIILTGLFVLASNYFMRPAGALIFRGQGMEIAFPFRSSLGLAQVYDFVDRAHSISRSGNDAASGDGGPSDVL